MPTQLEYIWENESTSALIKHILRKIFVEDWVLKLIALALTLALWLGVTGLSTPTTTLLNDIPLTFRFPNNTDVTNSPLNEVDLVVSGDKRRIDQINETNMSISLDLTGMGPSEGPITLTPENISVVGLPTGVKLDEIQPSRIYIKLEAVEEKTVSVAVESEGEPAPGFEVYGKTAIPPTVVVRGPTSFVRQLNFISTERVDITNKRGDFVESQVPLNLSNSKKTSLQVATVDVVFRIGEVRAERTFRVAASDFSGRTASVVLFGPRSIIDALSAEDMQVNITQDESGNDVARAILSPEIRELVETRSVNLQQ